MLRNRSASPSTTTSSSAARATRSLTVLAASGITGTADLKGKTVGVDTASTGDM